MSAELQNSREALDRYLQALTAHDDVGKHSSDGVIVTSAGTDQRADGREAVMQSNWLGTG